MEKRVGGNYMSQEKLEKRLFGTNGVRGVVGKDMTPDLALKVGAALGSMVEGRIAIGRDTRTSGESLSAALKAGLMACGCDVLDVGIIPTPGLQYLVRDRFSAGAMITASHNPPEYNGIKIIERDGTEMGDEGVVRLEGILFSNLFKVATWDKVGREKKDPSLVDTYIEGVVGQVPSSIGEGIQVVVDPGSGAGYYTTPAILSRLGCRVLTINATPDGTFPARLPEPSPDGLEALASLVTGSGAAFGVAHDGDADRAVFIDEKGRYVEENQEFALIEQFICRTRKGTVVTPVSSSHLIEHIASSCGCTVDYTPVGSIYVARRMMEMIDKGGKVVLGGEGNGGLIYPDHQFCRDGAMTAAMMVHLLASTKKPLSLLLDNLPVYHMIKEKLFTKDGKKVVRLLERVYSEDLLDKTDGIKIVRDRNWALVRASGTEPIIRIMVESPSKEKAEMLFTEVLNEVKKVLGNKI